MEDLKDKIKQELQKSDLTVPQLCKNLKIEDEFDVLSVIGDLESTNEVAMTGMKKFYRPNGCAGYLAEYGCVE